MGNNNKLKIVIPLLGVTRGGGVRVISELANGLVNRGHEVVLVTPPVDSFPFPLDHRVRLVSRTKKLGEGNILGRFKDFFFTYKIAKEVGNIVLSNYYTTSFIGWMLQVFNKKKHVYFIQGYEAEFFDKRQSFANKIKTSLAKLSYKIEPDLRITISQFIKDKIGKEDIVIINDGIDPEMFRPSADRSKGNLKKVIGTIALTELRKGFYDFIKAIEIISKKRADFEVLLFTSRQDTSFDLKFPYTIKYPSNDTEVVACMQNCDIFISASHLEGFGLPGLEAMACGAALITTNSGGITQYATHEENALIVDVGDSEAIAAAIERLLDQPAFLDRISAKGLETSAGFTWEIMCENFERELTKL